MKKFLPVLALAALLAACGGDSSKTESTTTDTTTVSSQATKMDTTSVATAPATDTAMKSSSAGAAVKDGMMTMKDGKMMVMKNGTWDKMTEAMTCTNGCKVAVNGEVTKNGKKKMLTEGMMIDKDGQIMDTNGKMVDETAWK